MNLAFRAITTRLLIAYLTTRARSEAARIDKLKLELAEARDNEMTLLHQAHHLRLNLFHRTRR